jgi:hypothetical protein
MLVNFGFTGSVRRGMGVRVVVPGVSVPVRMGVHDDFPQTLAAAAVMGADLSDAPALGAVYGFLRSVGHMGPPVRLHPQAFTWRAGQLAKTLTTPAGMHKRRVGRPPRPAPGRQRGPSPLNLPISKAFDSRAKIITFPLAGGLWAIRHGACPPNPMA